MDKQTDEQMVNVYHWKDIKCYLWKISNRFKGQTFQKFKELYITSYIDHRRTTAKTQKTVASLSLTKNKLNCDNIGVINTSQRIFNLIFEISSSFFIKV